MKKYSAAALLGLWLLISMGCSSAPSGTMSVENLKKNMAAQLGQNVVVVALTDVRTELSSFKMFKLYESNSFVWASIPEGTEEPPQGYKVRVTGVVKEKEFPAVGKIYFIEATKVEME
jgi:hypothetical protein